MEKKEKILVIDDEQGIREMLSFSLKQYGYEVLTAGEGEEGIIKVKEEKPVIVICDIKMPGMDGVSVLKEIKNIDSEIEVIMATAYGTMETAIESLKKGAFDYVNKPLNIGELNIVIERAMEKRSLKETIALYEISKAVFSTIETKELLKIIIDSTTKVLKADDASLMLFDDTEKLYIAISYGLSEEIQKETRLSIGERIAGWVAENKQPVILIDGLKNDVRFVNIKGREEIKSAIVMPLTGKDKMMGVLNINRINIVEHFTENDLHKANIFTSLVSLALQNVTLFNKIQTMQTQLLQSSKLASIGQLAAGLAHEIGNPLQTIMGNTDLLLMDNKTEELEAIKNASLQARTIIENLLDFSRQKEMKFFAEDVNKLVDKTLLLYGKQLELKKIKIIKHYQKGLPKINISASHIEQVFLNLITNSQKAMPEGGTLTITTHLGGVSTHLGGSLRESPLWRTTTEAILTKEIVTSPDGHQDSRYDFIEISFKDTGIGISKENQHRIFEPFFTTYKDGTGLGLSVSYGIVKQHGGEIIVFSDGEGKGAEFAIKLPTNFLGREE